VIVLFTCDGTPTITWPAGWTEVILAATAHGTATTEIRYRDCDGSEGATIQITTSAAEQSSHQSARLAAHGSDAPECASAAFAAGVTSNPPNLAPAGGALDYLWLCGFGANTDAGGGAVPATYTEIDRDVLSAAGVGSCRNGWHHKAANASSENPGNVTVSASTGASLAFTIAVYPVTAASYTPVSPIGAMGFFGV
jgi:hypothetical protein